MNAPAHIVAMAAMVAIAGTALLAQAPLGDSPRLTLQVLSMHLGKRVARLPAPKAGKASSSAFTVEGRKVAWRIGEHLVEDGKKLSIELDRVARDPASQRPDPEHPGSKCLMPLVVTAADDVYWRDVAETVDAARAAGFVRIHLVTPREFSVMLWAKMVDEPVLGDGAVVAPRLVFHEPDDLPPKWRPVGRVLQDGRIEMGGATVFDPAKRDDGKALRAAVERAAANVREHAGAIRFGPQQVELLQPQEALLIHADQWAPWVSVRAIMEAATAARPAFCRLDYAVADQDLEARLRQGERFPEPRARGDAGR
jgi:hypothetical protein